MNILVWRMPLSACFATATMSGMLGKRKCMSSISLLGRKESHTHYVPAIKWLFLAAGEQAFDEHKAYHWLTHSH